MDGGPSPQSSVVVVGGNSLSTISPSTTASTFVTSRTVNNATTTSSMASPITIPTQTATILASSNGSKASIGLDVGIGVGIGLVAILLAIIGWYTWRRRRRLSRLDEKEPLDSGNLEQSAPGKEIAGTPGSKHRGDEGEAEILGGRINTVYESHNLREDASAKEDRLETASGL